MINTQYIENEILDQYLMDALHKPFLRCIRLFIESDWNFLACLYEVKKFKLLQEFENWPVMEKFERLGVYLIFNYD